MRSYAKLSALLFTLLFGAEARVAAEPLGLPPVPAELAGTPAMRQLGEKLFFDRGLAANGTLSCAMCHIPAQGLTSNQSALSIGVEGRTLRRNAPSLYNVVYKHYLFHDGRETDLAAQVWGPLLAPDEMGNPAIGPLLARLRAHPDYGPAFNAVFPGEGLTMMTLGRAIAAYEATLLRGDSRFDKAIYGGQPDDLSDQEWRGYQVFMSKGGCSECHSIGKDAALFTDQSWHNTGVAFRVRNASPSVRVEIARGVVKNVDVSVLGLTLPSPRDVGRFEITNNPVDRWAYTTPSLRALAETMPYMHDGSFVSLEEVVDFYDQGGGKNPALDEKIHPLGLTRDEKAALVAFLKAL